MNIPAEKIGLIEWIAKLNDVSVLEKLRKIQEEHSNYSDWWDDLSSDDKASIERGLKDIEEGKINSHDEARKIYKTYL